MATVDEMMKQGERKFKNIKLEVRLTGIITDIEKGKITLVFYSPKAASEYRKSYIISDTKGRVDFNRAMFLLGCNKKNYGIWLNKMMAEEIMIKISINDNGFIRYIKAIDKHCKEYLSKCLIIDTIEGLTSEDKKFLKTLSLEELREEFGR